MLIEVLVSVLLFSVGVLALVGLQANMTKTQGATKVRTDASYLANEVIGMMWADVLNVASYSTTSCTGYARCSVWSTKVGQSLPNGQAAITVVPDSTGSGSDVTITISWSLPDGGTHQYSTTTTIHAS
jgi:type IV pilus assembly protein PilV